jgi:ribosome-associated protein YbcJ (S4-like RNA binding protein)
MAPWVSSGASAKAMLAALNISLTAAAKARGRPWPP